MRCAICDQWNRPGVTRCMFCGNDPAGPEDRTRDPAARPPAEASPALVPPPATRTRAPVPLWFRVALPAAVVVAWSLFVRFCR